MPRSVILTKLRMLAFGAQSERDHSISASVVSPITLTNQKLLDEAAKQAKWRQKSAAGGKAKHSKLWIASLTPR